VKVALGRGNMVDSLFERFHQRLSSLGDDDFFALADAIEQLGNICSGFGEGDVGDHGGVGVAIGVSIINRGARCRGNAIISRVGLHLFQSLLCRDTNLFVGVIDGKIVEEFNGI
jgi:hypothetical protein